MLNTYPGVWHQTYLWNKTGGVETLSLRNSARHRVLVVCLPDQPNKYGQELLNPDVNPFWSCTEFWVWYPDFTCFWLPDDWKPKMLTLQLEMVNGLVEDDRFDEVVVSGKGMTKSAEAALTLARQRSTDITNRATPGSHAHYRVNAIIGSHLKKVA